MSESIHPVSTTIFRVKPMKHGHLSGFVFLPITCFIFVLWVGYRILAYACRMAWQASRKH